MSCSAMVLYWAAECFTGLLGSGLVFGYGQWSCIGLTGSGILWATGHWSCIGIRAVVLYRETALVLYWADGQ